MAIDLALSFLFDDSDGASTVLDFTMLEKFGIEAGDIVGLLVIVAWFEAGDVFGVESLATVGIWAIWGYIIFFTMLYVYIVTTFIKFYLGAGLSYVLMSFSAFEKTKEITNKALNGVFSQAVEVYVLVAILNVTDFIKKAGAFEESRPISDIKTGILVRYGIVIFMYFLIREARGIASAMLAGAIANIGIGLSAMSAGASRMGNISKPIAGDMDKASYGRANNLAQEAYGNKASAKTHSSIASRFKKLAKIPLKTDNSDKT